MTTLDIALILWLTLSFFSGFRMGFIYKAGTVIGFGIGIIFASQYTPLLVGVHTSPLKTAAVFFLILSLVSKCCGLIAWFINKLFNIIAIIPFLKTFNRLLGGVLGVMLSCFIASSVLFIAQSVVENQDMPGTSGIGTAIAKSTVSQRLLKLSIFYQPLLSEKLEDFFATQRKKIPRIPSADILMR
ncbi:MAG: CvpA family protein [Candidatus Kerfeldbacteria bacterium]|nr:CvpA family protein [Candidatus Kerfeldbacteria bacterium]